MRRPRKISAITNSGGGRTRPRVLVRNTKRALICSLLTLMSGCATLQASFNPHDWATRRWIKAGGQGLSYVVVNASMYQDSKAHLRDLRLIRDRNEIPFALKILQGAVEQVQRPAALTDKAFVPGIGVRFVMETEWGGSHDQVSIETSRKNFRQLVRVETSDDRLHWEIVRRDGTIFDVSSVDKHAAGLSISYPTSTRRYVRVAVEGWTDPKWLSSASVNLVRTTPAHRDLVAILLPSVTQDGQTRTANLDFNLGFERPYDRITFDTDPGWFSRQAEVLTSPDERTGRLREPTGSCARYLRNAWTSPLRSNGNDTFE